VILGLDQSEAEYDACIRSLDRSLSSIATPQQGDEAVAAACSYVGLSSTADCESNLRATLWNEENIGAR
jgi:hypothetical protein